MFIFALMNNQTLLLIGAGALIYFYYMQEEKTNSKKDLPENNVPPIIQNLDINWEEALDQEEKHFNLVY